MAKITQKQRDARRRNAAVARASRKKSRTKSTAKSVFVKTYKGSRGIGMSKVRSIREAASMAMSRGGGKRYEKLASLAGDIIRKRPKTTYHDIR